MSEEWTTEGQRFIVFIICVIQHFNSISCGFEGTSLSCDKEGEIVHVELISDDPCFHCICINKTVQCDRRQCPSMDGCHTILYPKPKGTCCEQCKGCDVNGRKYSSGTEWMDPSQPCQVQSCFAGVVTSTQTKCHAPCRNPISIPGQCCPVCKGCRLGKKVFSNGQIFKHTKDKCVTCRCQNGNIQCTKRACPVLNCHDKYIHTPKGECCPVCRGSRPVFDPAPFACLFQTKIFRSSKSSTIDRCTLCSCHGGTMFCRRETCPVLKCSPKNVITDPTKCCPVCKKRNKKRRCRYIGRKYKHGKTWKPDVCSNCSCRNGKTRCQIEHCSNVVECPPNHRLQRLEGECCARCIEKVAVCAVFGDPHYRTFDGKIFNFQGTCKYVLTEDCSTGTKRQFQVRVRNYARLTGSFAWTKSVSIHLKGVVISLLQKSVVKIDRKKVRLPIMKKGVYSITKSGYSVIVSVDVGLRVVWDGDSYVEVSVPKTFKNKVCGLCGNYNGIKNDDFFGKRRQLFLDPTSFGNSWRIGSKRLCHASKKSNANDSPCKDVFSKRLRAHRDCSTLRSYTFAGCRLKVPVAPYYRSCITDMCDCPRDRKCACEAITAYARACERQGVKLDLSNSNYCST